MQTQEDKVNQDQLIEIQECIQIQQLAAEDSVMNIDSKLEKKQHQNQIQEQETQQKQEQQIQENDSHNQQLTNQQTTFMSTHSNIKPFTYQLMKQYSIKQDQYCNAIAVNYDCTILVAGCGQYIKVFEFNQAMLKQVQIICEHNSNVITLNFMKRSDQFISGSSDHSIIIWARNENNSWFCYQKLLGHKSYIQCLALNNNEDIIASGGNDNTIIFWQKQNQWLCSQTIIGHKQCVFGLSFNEQKNRLISCGQDCLILVIEQSEQNKQWIIIQTIESETCGVRLNFIDDNTFTLNPWGEEEMYIFQMNSVHKKYMYKKVIKGKGGFSDSPQFPQQYIKSKCILLNKNGSNVSILRRQQNGEFTIEQSIEFQTHYIFGCMTDDGQYLITWDFKSKEYQIRKYQEQ
ncbi:unnamed protein product [Paramecium pentaurelia]|uniref:WD40-repeat-containing domain n=1 Tax=Paramecium pentaurelia TaxID=43138 RepID=A0A8S1TZI6_9CILI|nr:unnamed protein product [Paramecium pentaurelia]